MEGGLERACFHRFPSCPLRICMPLASACRLACPRFRIPRSHAAWRFRTRTHHHPTHPHHASRQSPIAAALCAFAFAFAFAFACAFHHHPHAHLRAHLRAAQHATSPTTAALLLLACRPLLTTGINKRTPPSQLNVRRPPSSSSAHTPTCHTATHMPPPFGTALHRCYCLPPAGHTGTVLCKHRASRRAQPRLLTALHRQLTPRWCLQSRCTALGHCHTTAVWHGHSTGITRAPCGAHAVRVSAVRVLTAAAAAPRHRAAGACSHAARHLGTATPPLLLRLLAAHTRSMAPCHARSYSHVPMLPHCTAPQYRFVYSAVTDGQAQIMPNTRARSDNRATESRPKGSHSPSPPPIGTLSTHSIQSTWQVP